MTVTERRSQKLRLDGPHCDDVGRVALYVDDTQTDLQVERVEQIDLLQAR